MISTETDRLIPPCCRPGQNNGELTTFNREETQIESKQVGINLSFSVDTIRSQRPPPFGRLVHHHDHRLPYLLQPLGRAGSWALWCVAPTERQGFRTVGPGYYAAIGPGLMREQSRHNAFRPVLHYRGAKVRIFKNRMRVPLKAGYL